MCKHEWYFYRTKEEQKVNNPNIKYNKIKTPKLTNVELNDLFIEYKCKGMTVSDNYIN